MLRLSARRTTGIVPNGLLTASLWAAKRPAATARTLVRSPKVGTAPR